MYYLIYMREVDSIPDFHEVLTRSFLSRHAQHHSQLVVWPPACLGQSKPVIIWLLDRDGRAMSKY